MGLFNKNKQNFNDLYDEDGYFIGQSDYPYGDSEYNENNNADNKDISDFRSRINNRGNQNPQQSNPANMPPVHNVPNQQSQHPYPPNNMGYGNVRGNQENMTNNNHQDNVPNNNECSDTNDIRKRLNNTSPNGERRYFNNQNRYEQQQPQQPQQQPYTYNNSDNSDMYDKAVSEKRKRETQSGLGSQSINIKVITGIFIYIFFILFGIINTTYEKGYVPQIINAQIRDERNIYNKTTDVIAMLEQLDDFKGTQELQDVSKNKSYQQRIPPLKASLKKVKSEIDELQSRTYKLKNTEKEYTKIEMINMTIDLLKSEEQNLNTAIKYYETIGGFADLKNQEVIDMTNGLLDTQNQYKNKMASYKIRFEQIKKQELLIDK